MRKQLKHLVCHPALGQQEQPVDPERLGQKKKGKDGPRDSELENKEEGPDQSAKRDFEKLSQCVFKSQRGQASATPPIGHAS